MASKGSTVATDLFSATRLTNSTNGNPRFDLHTSDGTFRTQSDASCSYDVDNIVRTIPRGETIPVVLHTTPAGRVWNIERPAALTDEDRRRIGYPWRPATDEEAAAILAGQTPAYLVDVRDRAHVGDGHEGIDVRGPIA